MDDLIRQLLGYLRGAWRFRWWGLAVAWVVALAGAVVVWRLPDKYEASARVFVDTQSVLAPLMAGLAVPSDVSQQVLMLSKTLVSRPNTEKLIRMADLDLAVKNKTEREALIDGVMKRIQIRSGGRDNLFTLSFQDTEPQRARRVVEALVSIFVESGLGDKRKDTDTARKFIEDQIKGYEQKLMDAEGRLKEFKLKNVDLLTDTSKDSVTRVGEVVTALRQAQLELREAENSRDALRRQVAGEDPVLLPDTGASVTGVSIPELDGRIDAMKKNLDALLQRYTEQHPDVVGTRRVIELLEKQKDEEVAARRKAGVGTGSAANNPVYQQIRVSLIESEATVATLQARVAEYQERLATAQRSARLGPQIEQEYAQLNRDYEIHRQNYQSLVSRRESANISVDMESAAGVAEFRVIDPPSVPSKPAAPNRTLLLPLVALAALGAGAVVSFLISQIRPAFNDGRELREVTGLPVLGTVSRVPDPASSRARKRSLVAFLSALASLLGVLGALTAVLALGVRVA